MSIRYRIVHPNDANGTFWLVERKSKGVTRIRACKTRAKARATVKEWKQMGNSHE